MRSWSFTSYWWLVVAQAYHSFYWQDLYSPCKMKPPLWGCATIEVLFLFCFVFSCSKTTKSAFQSLHDKFYFAWLMLVQCRVRAWPWKPLLTTSLEEVNYNEFALWSLKGRTGYWWAIKVKRKRKASLKWHHGDNGVRFHTTTTWIGIHWGLDDTHFGFMFQLLKNCLQCIYRHSMAR